MTTFPELREALTARLRDVAEVISNGQELGEEAADFIDAQAAGIKRLREALQACLDKGAKWHPCDPVVIAARAALEQTK